jgi:hypothetical protein
MLYIHLDIYRSYKEKYEYLIVIDVRETKRAAERVINENPRARVDSIYYV